MKKLTEEKIILNKVIEWLQEEVNLNQDIVEAHDNNDDDITTSGDAISFNGQLNLTGNSIYTTGGTLAGAVTFTSQVEGSGSLAVTGNTINFVSAVGNVTALSSLSGSAATR